MVKLSSFRGIKNPEKISAFTLVELIVVIVILAILATIAFTSYETYTISSRDSRRLSDMRNIETGLGVFQVKSGYYPVPVAINSSQGVLSGSIDGTAYTYLGVVGDAIVSSINMSKTPLDPVSGDRYLYGVSANRKFFQVATVMERTQAYQPPVHLVDTAYAYAVSPKARVSGDYPGYMKFTSGSSTYIANVPSLLWSNSESITIFSLEGNYSTMPHFIVDKESNLPYPVGDAPIGEMTPDMIVQSVAGTGAASFTGVDITSILSATTPSQRTAAIEMIFGTGSDPASQTLLASFGGNLEEIQTKILGNNISAGASATPVAITCDNGFHSENGATCISNTKTAQCSQSGASAHAQYTVSDVSISWDSGSSSWNTPENCAFTCTDGYTGATCSVAPQYSSSSVYSNGDEFTFNGATVTVTAAGRGISNTKYPTCPVNDLVIWNNGATAPKIWALCNVGSTSVSTGYQPSANDSPTPTEATAGKFFQWGESTAWSYSSGVSTSDNCVWNRDAQSCGASAGFSSWQTPVTDTSSSSTPRWGDWSMSDTRGPCASGYHVPTQPEWVATSTILGSDRNTMVSTLKIPMGGCRYNTTGALNYVGVGGCYWSSSPHSSSVGYDLNLTTTAVNPSNWSYWTFGALVRCLKD